MSIQALIADFSRYVHRISDVDVCQMAGLAEGTNAATLKTTNQIIYGIYNTHGIIKAATDSIAKAINYRFQIGYCLKKCSHLRETRWNHVVKTSF